MSDRHFEHLNRRVHGVSLIAAPIVLLTSSLFHLRGGGMDSDDVGGALQILAFFFFILAVLGLTQLLAGRRPVAAIVLRVLLVFGCVYGAINGLGSALAEAAGAGIMALPSGLAKLLIYPGLAFPLSLMVVGVILWRSKAVPALAGIALAVAGLLFPVGRIPDIVTFYFLTDALLIVSMGWIGLRLLMVSSTGN